jgi:N-acetylglucosaminyldiphosphoundecaprenol N-acetyl-beta-D-mannosaminyltransferase
MSVFGIPIEGTGGGELIERLSKGDKLWIVTANPEILLEARKNPDYRNAVRAADVRTADGFGLFLWLKYVLRRKPKRLTGVELSEKLLELASRKNWRVGLIGAAIPYSGTAAKAAEVIRKRYSDLLVHAEDGGNIGKDGSDDSEGEEARHRLTLFNPHVLLVAFGHPKQELWIKRHRSDFPNLAAIVGVGGTFDFWAGNVLRAPKWMRMIGLEWFWRLLNEPRRAGRIMKAVFIFPILAALDRFRA